MTFRNSQARISHNQLWGASTVAATVLGYPERLTCAILEDPPWFDGDSPWNRQRTDLSEEEREAAAEIDAAEAIAKALAARGYLVVQPQFRGSSGFGKEHRLAGHGEWGRKMQDDLTDAVEWAVEQGIADPDNVGIYGASYGGYATMAGLTIGIDDILIPFLSGIVHVLTVVIVVVANSRCLSCLAIKRFIIQCK